VAYGGTPVTAIRVDQRTRGFEEEEMKLFSIVGNPKVPDP
jgi:hypothetical protein